MCFQLYFLETGMLIGDIVPTQERANHNWGASEVMRHTLGVLNSNFVSTLYLRLTTSFP